VNPAQLPVLDAEFSAANASSRRFNNLGSLSGHKLILYGANERFRFLEAQSNIAGLRVLHSSTDDQYAM